MFKKYCLFIIGFYFIYISTVKADILTAEREILIEFYQATKGEQWYNNTNWLSEDTCSWYGIICINDNRHLFIIDLEGNNLEGTLPESFANLVHLTHLNLETKIISSGHTTQVFENKIQLPKNFGNLTKLNRLILNGLNLTQLPESFGNLKNLTYLEMNYNKLSQLPKSFGNLQNLNYLAINYNQISQLPENFGNLTNLTRFTLLYNRTLTQLPKNFGNLTKLTDLNLSNNLISKLPDNFGNLTKLIFLNLSENKLSNLPDSFKNLTKLILTSESNFLALNLRNNHFITAPLFISEESLVGNPVETLKYHSNILFDWAETIFYDLFSAGNQQSQTFYIEDSNSPYFGQWYYRYYPVTQTYIAAKPNKQRNNYDIYILGGSFGNDLIYIDTLPKLIESKVSIKDDIKISNMDKRKAGEIFKYQYKTLDSEGVLEVKIKEYNNKQAIIERQLTLNGKTTKTTETQIFENSEEKRFLKEIIIESDKEITTLKYNDGYPLDRTYYRRQREETLPAAFFSSNLTPNEVTLLSNERLRINAVNLKITIPAGTFDIIKQTLKKENGQQIESWIDIKIGICLIKRVSDKKGLLVFMQVIQ